MGRHVLGVTCLMCLYEMHKGRSLPALGYRGVNFIGRATRDPSEAVPVGWGGRGAAQNRASLTACPFELHLHYYSGKVGLSPFPDT